MMVCDMPPSVGGAAAGGTFGLTNRYSAEWGVFVDKRGFRARGDWRAIWEGRPTAFGEHGGSLLWASTWANERCSFPLPLCYRL